MGDDFEYTDAEMERQFRILYPEDEMDREFQRCVLTPLVVPADDIPEVLRKEDL